MAAKAYRIKLGEFEVEGDKKFVTEMLKRYGPQEGATPVVAQSKGKKAQDKGIGTVTPVAGKSLSIREFIQQLDLKKHTDITLAFGYYLERYQGVSEFTPADISNCYYEAKLESSNTSQMIIQNIKRGFVMPSKKGVNPGKNRYTLTSSGEKHVQSKIVHNAK